MKRLDKTGNGASGDGEVPELDAAWFETAQVVVPPGKKQVTLRIDQDVLAWMQSQGKGDQSRINAILRADYEAHAK